MMVANHVDLIMNRVQQLSMNEQLQVIKRVAELLGRASQQQGPQGIEAQLAAMAADPEMQRELRQIEAEFAGTETDASTSHVPRVVQPAELLRGQALGFPERLSP